VACLFFADVLGSDRVLVTSDFRWYAPWRSHPEIPADTGFRFDSAQSYFPRRLLSRDAMLAGRAPLWNPHAALGMPLLADYQTAPFYPVNLLLLPFDPLTAMSLFMLVHFALAGIFMYVFLRGLGIGTLAALFSGLAFQWNGYFISYLGHPTHIATGVWLPLLLHLARRALVEQRARAFPAAFTIALACLLLAGFPQTLVYSVYALAAWIVFIAATELRGSLAQRAARVLALAPPGLLAFALAAPELLPTVELSRLSPHQAFTHESVWEINDIPFVTYLKVIFPDLFGNPVEGTSWLAWPHMSLPHPNDLGLVGYAGVLTPLLAIAGLVAALANGRAPWEGAIGLGATRATAANSGEPSERAVGSGAPRDATTDFADPSLRAAALRREALFCAGLVLVPVLFISVRFASRLIWRLPGWGFSTELHRVEFLAFVGVAMLAARGLEAALVPEPAREGRTARATLVVLACLVVAFLLGFLVLAKGLFSSIAQKIVIVLQYAGPGGQSLWITPRMLEYLTKDVGGWIAEMRCGVIVSVLFATAGVALILAIARRAPRVPPRERAPAPPRATLRGAGVLGIALLALHAADVLIAAKRYETPQPRAGVFVETDGIRALREAAAARPGRLFRIGNIQTFPPNIPGVFGLDDAGGYNALLIEEYGEFFDAIEKGAFSRGREVIRFTNAASFDSPLYRLAAAPYVIAGDWRDAAPLFRAWPFSAARRVRLSSELSAPENFGLTMASGAAEPAFVWRVAGEARFPRAAGAGERLEIAWETLDAGATRLAIGIETAAGSRPLVDREIGGRAPARGTIAVTLPSAAEEMRVIVRIGEGSAPIPAVVVSQFALGDAGAAPRSALRAGWRLVHAGDLVVFEHDRALPRARLVGRAIVEPDRHRALQRLAAGELDVERAAFVDRAPSPAPAGGPSQNASPRIVRSEPTRVEIETTAADAELLVLADVYYPGWEATIDGNRADILRANSLFRAVAVPGGEHRIVFRFVSPPFRRGVWLALAGAAAFAVMIVRGRRAAR
jgi:Bacterial membrane protein YfhO